MTSAAMHAAGAAAQKKRAAEDSLRQFVEHGWDVLEPGTKFVRGVHVDAVCEHLQAMIEDRAQEGSWAGWPLQPAYYLT